MSAIPLVLDKAALQDALNRMRRELGSLLTGVSRNAQGRAAVQAVEVGAESAMKALDLSISAYVALPGEIYMAADKIDQGAQSSGDRSLDVSSLLNTLQISASNQSAAERAKTDVQTASDAAATAKVPAGGNSDTDQLTMTLDATTDVITMALMEQADDKAANAVASEATKAKQSALISLLTEAGVADLTRVNLLARAALNDIPTPNFSETAAIVKNCGAVK